MKLHISKRARAFIEKCPSKHQGQIKKTILRLIDQPLLQDSKKLKGFKRPLYRLDVGEYRIVYEVNNADIMVFLVGKRNDSEVYRILERLIK
jgi:mRNA interferase RelE/StbE